MLFLSQFNEEDRRGVKSLNICYSAIIMALILSNEICNVVLHGSSSRIGKEVRQNSIKISSFSFVFFLSNISLGSLPHTSSVKFHLLQKHSLPKYNSGERKEAWAMGELGERNVSGRKWKSFRLFLWNFYFFLLSSICPFIIFTINDIKTNNR